MHLEYHNCHQAFGTLELTQLFGVLHFHVRLSALGFSNSFSIFLMVSGRTNTRSWNGLVGKVTNLCLSKKSLEDRVARHGTPFSPYLKFSLFSHCLVWHDQLKRCQFDLFCLGHGMDQEGKNISTISTAWARLLLWHRYIRAAVLEPSLCEKS